MSHFIDIVKRSGKRPSESFVRNKLHASVYAACLSVRTPDGEASHIAHNVCDTVIAWCATKPEVTSHDIRLIAAKTLSTFHPEAAYFYKHHRLII